MFFYLFRFSSDSWEKNRKYSEQAAAIVALHCLDIRKVQVESFFWGMGTALGELPPYFMARAHR